MKGEWILLQDAEAVCMRIEISKASKLLHKGCTPLLSYSFYNFAQSNLPFTVAAIYKSWYANGIQQIMNK